jgi:predicted DNA binding CopG/RHH family protein
MKIFLKVETLKKLIDKVDKMQEKYSIDDMTSCDIDENDYIIITFDKFGYVDKKKKIHEEVIEEDISTIDINCCYESWISEEVHL